MKTAFVTMAFAAAWLLIAPWIAKGYGEWRWPSPFSGQTGDIADAAIFYLPPLFLVALIAQKFLGKTNAPNQ